MAKWTIAQLREREVERLAKLKDQNPTTEDIDKARTIMNSFYRLSALSYRLCEYQNDEYHHDKFYTKEMEKKEDRWIKRLKGKLSEYGLTLYYTGICPSIGTVDEKGGVCEKINRYYYN